MREDGTVPTVARAAAAARLGGVLGTRATVLGATSVGVLAGLSSAAWITMRRQADVVTRVIETAALEMARAQNQIDPEITDPTQLRPPAGDGVHLPYSTRAVAGRTDAARGQRPPAQVMLGGSTSVGYATKVL